MQRDGSEHSDRLLGEDAAHEAECIVPEGPVRARAHLADGTPVRARDGALEIGDRRITVCDGLPGPFPIALAVHRGDLIVGFRAAGLYRRAAAGGAFGRIDGLPAGQAIRALAVRGETLWVGTGTAGLWRVGEDGPPRCLRHWVLGRRGITALHVSADGALEIGVGPYGWWRIRGVGPAKRVQRHVFAGCFHESAGRVRPAAPGPACALGDAPPASGLPSVHVSALAWHRGALWVGTFDRGLARREAGGHFVAVPGAPRFINALQPDAARGALYIATPKGLHRLDADGRVVSVRAGLPSAHVNSLALAPDGTLWIATGRGLVGLARDGRVRHVGERDGLPSPIVHAVAVTPDGAVWAGTAAGAARMAADGVRTYTQAGGALPHDWVNALLADGDAVLAGTYDAGVARLRADGSGSAVPGLVGLWVNPNGLHAVGGTLAVATLGDGLILRRGPHVRAVGGLPSDDVTAVLAHGDEVFIGTRGGLVRRRAHRKGAPLAAR